MNPRVFLSLAEEVSEQATCPRRKCGAVIAKDGAVVAVGWNGAAIGSPEVCVIENEHCVNSVHAEVRAITAAARLGNRTMGATMFSLERPCQGCLAAMAEAGIAKCWYLSDYHTQVHKKSYVSPELMDKLDVQQYIYGN